MSDSIQIILKATLMVKKSTGDYPYEINYFLPNGKIVIFAVQEAGNRFIPDVVLLTQGSTHIFFKEIKDLTIMRSMFDPPQRLVELYGRKLAETICSYTRSEEDCYFTKEFVPIKELILLDINNEFGIDY